MPWTAEYNERLAVVEVINQGAITAEELRRQTSAALELARKHRSNLLLLDAEQMQCAFSLFELVGLVESYEGLKMPASNRIAVVLPRLTESAHVLRFYETVARNRAYDVSVFLNRAAALKWLTEHPPVSPS